MIAMPSKEYQFIKLIYLAFFVATLFLLSLFIIHDYAVRDLNEQLQVLHYARQDFDAGVLHILLEDSSPSHWREVIGRQRLEQTITGIEDIAAKHLVNFNHLQDDVLFIKQQLLFLTRNISADTDLSQSIIGLRLKIEQLHLSLDAELQRELKRSRYWFLGLVCSVVILVLSLFVTLLRIERKRNCIYSELRNSQHCLSLIADNVDEAFCLYDPQNENALFVSSAFEKLWQLSVDDLYQESHIWLTKVHPDDRAMVKAILARTLQENTVFEYRLVLQSNEVRWINHRFFPVTSLDEDGEEDTLIVSVATDVTATKALNEQLMVAQKLEALGRLTGGIAHDFNNLLTVIMGNAQLIKDYLPQDSQFANIATMIVKAAERGASLNTQLLAFASKQKLNSERVDVCELLDDMQNMLRFALSHRKDICIEYHPCSNKVFCFVDAGQLQSAIINLCINAKDAMSMGGTIVINLEISGDNKFALLHVKDNGEGISDSVIPHIFEPFFTTKGKQKGSGLGLSMVYGFVKQSGGNIKVVSVQGKGSCFTLSLPLCADNN